ncbi:MAG: hypothetical protein U9P72_03255 [Campylobacterota bacterium]|nr:hypothetical protein [Campylobacterota bacterium]
MEKRLEKNIRAIFEKLSQGDFLSQSSINTENKKMYRICSENYDELYEYFLLIGFVLEKGDNYFYFSKNDLELSEKYFNKKMTDILELLELLSFMVSFDNDFSVGSKVSVNELVMAVEKNIALDSNLKSLKSHNKETIKESCESILKTFVNGGVMELIDSYTESYKALESLAYIIKFANELKIDMEIA